MKLIEYLKIEKQYDDLYYVTDVRRILNVMKDKGSQITPKEANKLWNMYSDNQDEVWIVLPANDDEIFEIIIKYAKIKYGEEI